jgi:hypothetical protein
VTGAIQAPSATQHISGNFTEITDVAPARNIFRGNNAYSQASTNTSGAHAAFGGGFGAKFYTILTASNLSGKTFTLQVNGTNVILTDGTDFTHSGTNSVEATNLAGAINANSTLNVVISATAVGAVVYINPLVGLYQLAIKTNAAGGDATATSDTDGTSYVTTPFTLVTSKTGISNAAKIFAVDSSGGLSIDGSSTNTGTPGSTASPVFYLKFITSNDLSTCYLPVYQ